VTLLPARSTTQTVAVVVETPLAGIDVGDTVTLRWSAVPKPVNWSGAVAELRPDAANVAVQLSALVSVRAKTVEPPEVVCAPVPVVVPRQSVVAVTRIAAKETLPPASCAWTVTSQAVLIADGLQVLAVTTSFEAGPAVVTVSVLDAEVRPLAETVTMQEPGTPVTVTLAVPVVLLVVARIG